MWRHYKVSRHQRDIATQNILIAGADPIGISVRDYLTSLPHSQFRFRGFVTLDEDSDDLPIDEQKQIVGNVHEVVRLAHALFVNEIIFARRPGTPGTLSRVLEQARVLGIDVRLIPSFTETLQSRSDLEYLGTMPTIILDRKKDRTVSRLVKRSFDITLTVLGLLAISPLCLIIAIAIKLQSAGPVFYLSERIGYKGRSFTCYKFRTMITNAASMQSQIAHLNERNGILFKIADDPRITRIGALLRKYSLDELPQLWNVLLGDMSLVGPRPSISSEVAQYETAHMRRLDIVPE